MYMKATIWVLLDIAHVSGGGTGEGVRGGGGGIGENMHPKEIIFPPVMRANVLITHKS